MESVQRLVKDIVTGKGLSFVSAIQSKLYFLCCCHSYWSQYGFRSYLCPGPTVGFYNDNLQLLSLCDSENKQWQKMNRFVLGLD